MRAALLILALGIAVASLLTAPPKPVTSGAPLLQGAQVPPDVLTIIQRSCQDCHSDLTHYPWYSYVAPVSFLIRRDVQAGRTRLNLSHWSEYTLTRRLRFLSEIANQVQEREMPLPIYTRMHPTARLTDSEIAFVFHWTQSERLRLINAVGQARTHSPQAGTFLFTAYPKQGRDHKEVPMGRRPTHCDQTFGAARSLTLAVPCRVYS